MNEYAQYDDSGNITAFVTASRPPAHARQIALTKGAAVRFKKVDVAKGELIDSGESPVPPDFKGR